MCVFTSVFCKNFLHVCVFIAAVRSDVGLFSYEVFSKDDNATVKETSSSITTSGNWSSVDIENQTLPVLIVDLINIAHNLSFMKIVECGITKIEPGAFRFDDTVFLDELVITGNDIYNLTEGIFNNLNIRKLNLSLNKIYEIKSTAFDNMTYLESIDLNNNELIALDSSWFFDCHYLKHINFSSNKITYLSDDSFQNIAFNENLTIDLSINIIKEIHSNTLGFIGDIEFLDLSRNKIQELHQDLFVNKTIRRLDLTSNNLTCLPESLFSQKNIRWFSIRRNPGFTCGCLNKVEEWKNLTSNEVFYPAIICEDRPNEVNIVYNENRIFRIPLLLSTSEFSGIPKKT